MWWYVVCGKVANPPFSLFGPLQSDVGEYEFHLDTPWTVSTTKLRQTARLARHGIMSTCSTGCWVGHSANYTAYQTAGPAESRAEGQGRSLQTWLQDLQIVLPRLGGAMLRLLRLGGAMPRLPSLVWAMPRSFRLLWVYPAGCKDKRRIPTNPTRHLLSQSLILSESVWHHIKRSTFSTPRRPRHHALQGCSRPSMVSLRKLSATSGFEDPGIKRLAGWAWMTNNGRILDTARSCSGLGKLETNTLPRGRFLFRMDLKALTSASKAFVLWGCHQRLGSLVPISSSGNWLDSAETTKKSNFIHSLIVGDLTPCQDPGRKWEMK